MLRDIRSGTDPEVEAVIAGLVAVRPDAVLLTRIDHDLNGVALTALADRLRAAGLDYPYLLAPVQNRGLPSGQDLDANGRLGDPDDAHGYGRFSGDGAMAVLSRWPVRVVADHAGFLWADLPDARLANVPAPLRALHRLSSSAHWELALTLPDDRAVSLWAWAATPPAFGARNPDRNHDEAAFWLYRLGQGPPAHPFVLIGLPNLGPGQGDPAALSALAAHPLLHPPAHGATASLPAGPARLSLIQPSRGLMVRGHGLHPEPPVATRHRMVWLDLALPPP
ncbi:MAG: endonuclease/exonuclease/phosphatase family protein [Gemmobacter sp.]|nr:endonuclease/exonuclease/phosphatase family protein [Gemmobacter sp.]